jgi:hypothetical protein
MAGAPGTGFDPGELNLSPAGDSGNHNADDPAEVSHPHDNRDLDPAAGHGFLDGGPLQGVAVRR